MNPIPKRLPTLENFPAKIGKLKLSENFINKLLGTKENGMGYHNVNVVLEGVILSRKIVNSEYLILGNNDCFDIADIKDIIPIN